jgi:hypothetical protein
LKLGAVTCANCASTYFPIQCFNFDSHNQCTCMGWDPLQS